MSQIFTASLLGLSLVFTLFQTSAKALDLDWHGQFRTETNWIYGYANGGLLTAAADQGYFIPNNGDSPASFQNLFFQLSPRVVVNDNISLFSNLWFGTPDKGIFGGDQVTTTSSITGSNAINNTRTGNSTFSANTFYAEVATDFGTFSVGRVPMNWGLGLLWNNGAAALNRMPSTADGFRLETKLGAFKFTPAVYKYMAGSNYGGTFNNPGAPVVPSTVAGFSSASDYSFGLTYNNDDEQLDLGILFVRRIAGMNANIADPFDSSKTTGYSYNVWDFFVKKKTGIFTVSAEIPLVTGVVGTNNYSTVAGALRADAQLNDHWKAKLNGGLANGQDSIAPGGSSNKFTAFAFHPDYRPGMMMFNYNFRNFSNGSTSPFYNPVTNAQYLSLGLDYNYTKWTHGFQGLYALAASAANQPGGKYYNTWSGSYQNQDAASGIQQKGLGFELDYSLTYDWDEAMKIGLMAGLYFPGKFYEFSNSATPNTLKTAFGTGVNLSMKF
jgi:hypothetical protein